jgi:hypothetical protein
VKIGFGEEHWGEAELERPLADEWSGPIEDLHVERAKEEENIDVGLFRHELAFGESAEENDGLERITERTCEVGGPSDHLFIGLVGSGIHGVNSFDSVRLAVALNTGARAGEQALC